MYFSRLFLIWMAIMQSSFSSTCNHLIVNYMPERALKIALYLQMDEGIWLDRIRAGRLCFAWLVYSRHNSLLRENNLNRQHLFRRQINPVSACSSVTRQGPRWQHWQKSRVIRGTGEEMKDNSPVDGERLKTTDTESAPESLCWRHRDRCRRWHYAQIKLRLFSNRISVEEG